MVKAGKKVTINGTTYVFDEVSAQVYNDLLEAGKDCPEEVDKRELHLYRPGEDSGDFVTIGSLRKALGNM